jgi:hypothetical protein
LLPPARSGPNAGRRLAEPPAEDAIEMRDIAKAGRESNIDDRQMQMAPVGQHCECALKPTFHNVLGERLSRLLEELLDLSPRQAEDAGDAVEIAIGIAEATRDLPQDRPQPRGLHPPLRNNLCGFGGRPERCGHEIEKVNADNRGQIGRWGFSVGCEPSQVSAEEVKRRSRMHRLTCQILRMGYQELKCGSPYHDISDPAAASRNSPLWPLLIEKVRPASIADALLSGLLELD